MRTEAHYPDYTVYIPISAAYTARYTENWREFSDKLASVSETPVEERCRRAASPPDNQWGTPPTTLEICVVSKTCLWSINPWQLIGRAGTKLLLLSIEIIIHTSTVLVHICTCASIQIHGLRLYPNFNGYRSKWKMAQGDCVLYLKAIGIPVLFSVPFYLFRI